MSRRIKSNVNNCKYRTCIYHCVKQNVVRRFHNVKYIAERTPLSTYAIIGFRLDSSVSELTSSRCPWHLQYAHTIGMLRPCFNVCGRVLSRLLDIGAWRHCITLCDISKIIIRISTNSIFAVFLRTV